MIVTCQKCSSRYHVDDAVIGLEGKDVRCARCKYVWFQEPCPVENRPAPPTPSYRPQQNKPSKKRPTRSRKYFWLVAGTIILVASVFFKRIPSLDNFFSSAQKMYTVLQGKGTPTKILNVRNVQSHFSKGKPDFIVQGEIVNTGEKTLPLPALRVAILGQIQDDNSEKKESIILKRLYHHLSQSQILPGEALYFECSLPYGHLPVTSVKVTF